jgi:hypothetical protein
MRIACALVWAALAAACGADGTAVIDGVSCESWTTVDGKLDGAGLAIWGASDDDVYLVGGPPGPDGTALLRRSDGERWTEIETGTPATLWWVWGAPEGKDVWMVGENGTILRYDGSAVREVASGTSAHLYGVWGSSSKDVWIVGGRPGPEEGPDDVVLHWDGAALEVVELPEARGAALFKVWGASADAVWIAGEAGTLWRRDPTGWVDESIATHDTLTTVHGCSAHEIYAVGGQTLYRSDGRSWAKVEDARILGVAAGVACGADAVLVVGSGGLKLRLDRASGEWLDETLEEPYATDFHGAWISPGGALWATGGDYVAPPSHVDRRVGVLARRGCR